MATDLHRPDPLLDDPIPFAGPRAGDAIEVAPRIWWVGSVTDDLFSCHAYLIEAGRSSVLLDPGSTLTIDDTLRKIQQVVSLDDIKSIVLHHVDPDCSDAVHKLGEVLTRPDVKILTEWRSAVLIKHLQPKFEITHVEDLGWNLDLGDGRCAEFFPTPYLHFPGAFVTYVADSGALLSADLFGGFNHARRLVAVTPEDFEDLRSFHEHYMPSREILMAGLSGIRARFARIEVILPQHGYIIPGPLVDTMFAQLFEVECGLMLMARRDVHLAKLIDLAAGVRRLEDEFDTDDDPTQIIAAGVHELGPLMGVESITVEASLLDGPSVCLRADSTGWQPIECMTQPDDLTWVVPLQRTVHGTEIQLVLTHHASTESLRPAETTMVAMLLDRVRLIIDHSLELRTAEQSRRDWERTATHDQLTGLLNRHVLDTLPMPRRGAGIVMIDIDHFKVVNDTWGHHVGDQVLTAVAGTVSSAVRSRDLVVRYGGEEIVVIVGSPDEPTNFGPDGDPLDALAERVRASVETLDLDAAAPGLSVTISLGIASIEADETLTSAINRADGALYEAKESGRNRVVRAKASGTTSHIGG